MTGRDLVSASLRKIGALASGEALAASDATDGLTALNMMIASWSTESLLINAKVREVFTLTAGTAAYTMGSGGTFNTTRPQKIENALIKIATTTPAVELPLKIVTEDQFAAIVVKDLQSSIPLYLYAEGTNPLETINLWPVPSVAYSLVLYSWKVLTQLTTIDDVLAFPPGYERALTYNLAIELAPDYGRQTSPEIQQIAMESKANIARMNTRPLDLRVDKALISDGGAFNWYTGDST